jgi:hypothetical protein
VENEKVGGLIFFAGNSYQEAELINDFQSLSQIPLLISADFGIESCVSAAVRGLKFPSHPKLDVTRTTF